jgi:hypothetical protein
MSTTALMPTMGRVARKSDDYVAEILARRGGDGSVSRLTQDQKVRKLALTLQDPVDGIRRLGVGMIGPVQLKLRYQGMTRNVLMEDAVVPGTTPEYDVFDDLGVAYQLNVTDGAVRVTPFEGKRIRAEHHRIASFPVIRKDDLVQMRINMVEQAQEETKQAIMKLEDSRLLTVIAAAQAAYVGRADHEVSPSHTITETSGYFTPEALYAAVATTDEHELESANLLVNVADHRDFYRWTINQTGWAFKDSVVAGQKIMTFGEFRFQKSIMVPKGTMYLLPAPEFLGIFSVLYSLDVEENHKVDHFLKGWVFDEVVAFLVLNPRGIASVVKA